MAQTKKKNSTIWGTAESGPHLGKIIKIKSSTKKPHAATIRSNSLTLEINIPGVPETSEIIFNGKRFLAH